MSAGGSTSRLPTPGPSGTSKKSSPHNILVGDLFEFDVTAMPADDKQLENDLMAVSLTEYIPSNIEHPWRRALSKAIERCIRDSSGKTDISNQLTVEVTEELDLGSCHVYDENGKKAVDFMNIKLQKEIRQWLYPNAPQHADIVRSSS